MTTIPLVTMEWKWAGTQLGLTYDSAYVTSRQGATLTGVIDGFPATVVERFYGHGAHVQYAGTNTVFNVQLSAEFGSGLALWPSRSPLRRYSLFNRHDVSVGDPDWDRAFVVRCSSSEAARRFFNPQRRAALAAANPRGLQWAFHDSEVRLHSRYLETDGELIVVRVTQLIEIAKAITGVNDAHV